MNYFVNKVILIFISFFLMGFSFGCKKETELAYHLQDIEIIAKTELHKMVNASSEEFLADLKNKKSKKYHNLKKNINRLNTNEGKKLRNQLVNSFKQKAIQEINSNYEEIRNQHKLILSKQFKCNDIVEINDLVAIFGVNKFRKLVSTARESNHLNKEENYNESQFSHLNKFSNSNAGINYAKFMGEEQNQKLLRSYFDKNIEKALSSILK